MMQTTEREVKPLLGPEVEPVIISSERIVPNQVLFTLQDPSRLEAAAQGLVTVIGFTDGSGACLIVKDPSGGSMNSQVRGSQILFDVGGEVTVTAGKLSATIEPTQGLQEAANFRVTVSEVGNASQWSTTYFFSTGD